VSFSETALSKDASLSAMADYSDVLARGAFGPYRSVLGEVTMHPVMGIYLNSLGNRAEDPITGRLPDENYAREVMQLFSIGLVRLDDSAEPVRGANGAPIPTYTSGDVSGLAKVFTGLGLNCPEAIRFPYISACASGARRLPMKGDPRHHSTSEKRFLGMTIPAQVGVAPESDISQALDLLAGHPNTAPFIVRQLIQRLVGSSPSSQYVSSVVSVWRSTGGNLGRVVKAILLHPEARGTVQPDGVVRSSNPGRLREPVLRFTQLLRAFSPSSRSGFYMIGRTSDPATQLGMTAFFAPSVFNFYRPGFLAPGSLTAAQGLTAPELQMAGEINAAGWVNFVRSGLSDGWGLDPVSKRTDVELTLDAAERLAPKPAELLDFVSQRLLVEPLPVDVQNTIIAVISSVPLPQSGAVGEAARNRVRACILLIVVSPHYQVQS
jgi:uncharacterized protein (DUF1800 family)